MLLAYFSNLVAVRAGQIIVEKENFPIMELIINSNIKTITPHPFFFAIVGINYNGHNYIKEAYHKGIRQFVVTKDYNHAIMEKCKGLNILQVTNTVMALQQFSAFYRSKYQLPILGITGSNGKTSVKEWMDDFLSRRYKTISNPHSYNMQISVPISVSLLKPIHDYAIFEATISTIDEMEKLALVIQPTDGLLTNIAPGHSQGFPSLIEKIKAKAVLFANYKTTYYCEDHKPIDTTLHQLYGRKKSLINWSFYNLISDYIVTRKELAKTTALEIATADQRNTFLTPIRDHATIDNIVHYFIYLLHNGFDPIQLQSTLLQLKSIPIRMTVKTGMHQYQIIEDTYTNELKSLQLALAFMQQQKQKKQTVMLSDIVRPPNHKLYQKLERLLAQYGINRIIGIGAAISHYAPLFSIEENTFFTTLSEFIVHKTCFQDEIILVKGVDQSERLVQAIENNSHDTVLEIDIQAIKHNLAFFRTKLMANTKIMAMVKASAYGTSSNSFELVSALQRDGIDYFGVAYIEEGIRLRQAGITGPIMVMNPTNNNFDALVAYALEPVVYSLPLLCELSSFTAERAVKQINIHLKIETGMSRLGIDAYEIDPIISQFKQSPNLDIVSIFSHLAGSESKKDDDYTLLQAERFIEIAAYIAQHLKINPLKHLLNTNGILRFPQFQFDMVRLGIGLYGVGVCQTIQPHLRAAHKLKTTISQVKQIKKGNGIGYNRNSIATQKMTIATIPIGYADGLSRSFGCGKGRVVIQGRYCPIIGNVSMDMTMIDITGIEAQRGDEVIIFSAENSVDELAKRVGTISYELLTQISQRVKRIYHN